jgi:hypothetical protein
MTSNRSVSAAIGEHLALGELLKRGAEAYLAHGETQKGWDIVLVNSGGAKRVQVKTINWPRQHAVNGKLADRFDFLVVVLLDRGNPRSRFFVFPANLLDPLLSAHNTKRKSGNRTLTMSNKAMEGKLSRYEDNWNVLL